MNYNKTWTKFETHCLAFSILRKHLYPQYLVRGEYKLDTLRADIAVFKANFNGEEPTLKVIVQVKPGNVDYSVTRLDNFNGIPVIEIKGGNTAYKIVDLVKEYL